MRSRQPQLRQLANRPTGFDWPPRQARQTCLQQRPLPHPGPLFIEDNVGDELVKAANIHASSQLDLDVPGAGP